MTASLVALLLLIVIGLVICSALFSGLETALFVLRAHQLRRLESNHPALAGFLQKFRENPRRVLAVILLGSALVNVFLIVICLALLWETPRATVLPPWLIAVSLFAIIVFFCDLIPKLVALSAPYRLSTLGVFSLRALIPLLETVGSAVKQSVLPSSSWSRPGTFVLAGTCPMKNSKLWFRSVPSKARSRKPKAR